MMHRQSSCRKTWVTRMPLLSRAAVTSASRVSRMPEQIRAVSASKNEGSVGARPIITSATMFTSTTSQCCRERLSISVRSAVTLPVRAVKAPASKPLKAAFSRAISSALGSISTPVAALAPSRRAAMERIPLPLPRSRHRLPGVTRFSIAMSTIWVEGWVPVPKVRPGSRITFSRPPWSSSCSQ